MPDWLFPLYHSAVYWASAFACTFGFSLRIEGRRRIPRRGPVLLIANHQSFLDPTLVGLASPRPLCYLARKTLFKNPAFAWLLRSLQSVPVDQQGIAKEGLQAILAQLQRGRAVLVFPEGERTHDGRPLALRPGIQLLIKRAQAPIVPVGIAGAFAAWPRWRPLPRLAPLFLPPSEGTIAVVVGKPLDGRRFAAMSKQESLAELRNEIDKVQERAEKLRRK